MTERSAPGSAFVFIHINKTGGTSIGSALGIKKTHATAEEIKSILSPHAWYTAFKFAFVRNPWDKVVSQYCYKVSIDESCLRSNSVAFADWVKLAYLKRDPLYCEKPKFFMPQYRWLVSANGLIEVDFIGRFENLQNDFRFVASVLGVRGELPHLNASCRRPYREYYDDETAEIIRDRFEIDTQVFGYDF